MGGGGGGGGGGNNVSLTIEGGGGANSCLTKKKTFTKTTAYLASSPGSPICAAMHARKERLVHGKRSHVRHVIRRRRKVARRRVAL